MNLYGGSLTQRVGLDVREDVPAIQVAGQIQDVQIEPLLRDLDVESKIRGTSDFELDVATRGLTPDQLKRSLGGTTRFMFTDGAVKGINIAYAIRRAKAAIRGEPLPPEQRELETDFSELSGSATIVDGILTNDDLVMKSPLLRVTGAGTIDIPGAEPDYRLNVTIVSTTQGQGGKELAELEGLVVPVQVAGSFEKLELDVDIAGVLREVAKREAAQTAQGKVEGKLEQELKDRLGEEQADQLKDAIRGLFGR
jgi:AsmA protein